MSANAPFFVDTETITLGRDGIWRSDGEEITHSETCRMFFRNLHKDESGYFIQVGRETKRIEVEDTAYFVTRIEGDPTAGYELRLTDETQVRLDPATLKYRPGRLSCSVRTRIGEEEARFLRAPYFDLLKHLEEDQSSYYLSIAGTQVTLARK